MTDTITETVVENDALDEQNVPTENVPTESTETFPREYVEKLRQEAAEARVKAKRADDLARALFASRVAATGRLADPSDLPFDENLLDDAAAMNTAIDELLADHPHYAARTPRGNVGQGAMTSSTATVDLAGLLRARA